MAIEATTKHHTEFNRGRIAATAAREITYFQGLLSDLDLKQIPTTLYDDNQGCIAMTKAECANKRTKHIDVKHKYVNELVSNQTIRLEYLPTDKMAADILTKPLTGEKYITHRSTLLGTDPAHRGGVLVRGDSLSQRPKATTPKGETDLPSRRTKMTGSSKEKKDKTSERDWNILGDTFQETAGPKNT